MSLSGAQVTRLWPYGGPGFNYGSFAGKTESADPPTLLGQIPNLSAAFDSGTHTVQLGDYAANFDSVSISPAIEVGWTFNTTTGELVYDTDEAASFGLYTLTFTNANGDTDSNAFGILVYEPSSGSSRRRMYVPPQGSRRKRKPLTTQALINRISRIIR